ncbi:unnamed protein product [Heterobilharzia americana]|nr:unnamed protein product [Heterobilharzia americana]
MRNFSLAKENVDKNNLSEDIKLFHVAENASSLDLIFRSNGENESKNTTYLHAVMANPPFFSDASDAVGSNTCRSLNRPPPKTVSSAARHESQTTGGEVYFCMRLIRESLRYSTRVGVFTIMLGKKSSVPLIRRIMNKLKITQMSVYEMCQGRIMRWGVAWTFLPNFPFPESDFRRLRKMERPPLTYQLPNPVSCLRDNTVEALLDWLRCEFKQLGMKVLDQKNRAELGGVHLNITATVNTWTHVRRKRREAQRLLISNQIDAKNNGNSTNNGCNSTEEPMEVGVVIDVNPKNPLKRIHHNDSFEMESISTSTLQTTTTEMGTDISVIEIANQSKRIRKLTHAEICEEGEDAWDNGDEHDYNDNNNTCSSKMLSTPSSTDACTHLIQANVFVEYLNTDSFQTNELISSSMSTSCLFPNGINNNDYGDNIQKNEKSRQDASDNGNDHVTDNATAVDDDDSDDDDDVILQEDHGPLVIKIAWVNGTCREAANQILCYLKNRLK